MAAHPGRPFLRWCRLLLLLVDCAKHIKQEVLLVRAVTSERTNAASNILQVVRSSRPAHKRGPEDNAEPRTDCFAVSAYTRLNQMPTCRPLNFLVKSLKLQRHHATMTKSSDDLTRRAGILAVLRWTQHDHTHRICQINVQVAQFASTDLHNLYGCSRSISARSK